MNVFPIYSSPFGGLGGYVFPFCLETVEYIDVHFCLYASHTSIRAELPIDKVHVWFIFSVASNPYVIVLHQVGSRREILIDEGLADIEDRAYMPRCLHHIEPLTDMSEHRIHTSHLPYLRW